MKTMPLTFISSGKNCSIFNIEGGDTLRKKLMEMGFNTGAKVEIVKNDVGPLIIGIGGSRVAIGRGMAQKITVEV
ncbi:ferrous iron transport protein A [uncultured Clostridium sp.]|uniref:FeoA family protein n=1 Tax=uncultured Clostridium sp. TaxID=59620 RepID=UPI0028EA8412|nr:ferrous iron transport protein A [uncultured Clostridium sp.]